MSLPLSAAVMLALQSFSIAVLSHLLDFVTQLSYNDGCSQDPRAVRDGEKPVTLESESKYDRYFGITEAY